MGLWGQTALCRPWVCGEAELRLVGLFVSQLGLIGGVSGHCLFLVSFSFLFRLCSLFGELGFLLSSSFKDYCFIFISIGVTSLRAKALVCGSLKWARKSVTGAIVRTYIH